MHSSDQPASRSFRASRQPEPAQDVQNASLFTRGCGDTHSFFSRTKSRALAHPLPPVVRKLPTYTRRIEERSVRFLSLAWAYQHGSGWLVSHAQDVQRLQPQQGDRLKWQERGGVLKYGLGQTRRLVPALTRMVGGELVELALSLLLAATTYEAGSQTRSRSCARVFSLTEIFPVEFGRVCKNDWSSQATVVFFGHPRDGARQPRMTVLRALCRDRK